MATNKTIDFSSAFKSVISHYKWPYEELKEEREAVIKNIVLNERNSIAILPTGFGKNECYIIRPLVLDEVRQQIHHSLKFTSFIIMFT